MGSSEVEAHRAGDRATVAPRARGHLQTENLRCAGVRSATLPEEGLFIMEYLLGKEVLRNVPGDFRVFVFLLCAYFAATYVISTKVLKMQSPCLFRRPQDRAGLGWTLPSSYSVIKVDLKRYGRKVTT